MPTVDRGDMRIYYELSGAGNGELLVLSNSLGSSVRMWDKVLAALEGQYRVLRYDTRGHGKSGIPPGPYTLDQLAGDVLFLLDHLGADRADFCGLSLGGMVGQSLGIHAPHRVRRLVLANTAARILTQDVWDQRIAYVRQSGMAELAATTLGRWFTTEYRDVHPQEMETIRGMIASTDPSGYIACCGALRDADLRGQIGAIRAPSLVISGSHDPATPAADGRALAAALPNSQYVELNSSHLSAWERADEFAHAILAFLETRKGNHG